MKTSAVAFASAIAGAMALSTVAVAQPAATPGYKFEKCFGIAKAGKNDCQTANSSCAGTSKKDQQADAWIYLPAGTCGKIHEGSLEPKKS